MNVLYIVFLLFSSSFSFQASPIPHKVIGKPKVKSHSTQTSTSQTSTLPATTSPPDPPEPYKFEDFNNLLNPGKLTSVYIQLWISYNTVTVFQFLRIEGLLYFLQNHGLVTRELLGTFSLVFFGTTINYFAHTTNFLPLPLVASLWGLLINFLVLIFGGDGVSFNPAITIAGGLAPKPKKVFNPLVSAQRKLGRMFYNYFYFRLCLRPTPPSYLSRPRQKFFLFLAAQFVGAFVAAKIQKFIHPTLAPTSYLVGSFTSLLRAFLAEFVGTALIALAAFHSDKLPTFNTSYSGKNVSKNDYRRGGHFYIPSNVAVGTAVAISILLSARASGAGFNPARELGPRLALWVGGGPKITLAEGIVYGLGPILGGVFGSKLLEISQPVPSEELFGGEVPPVNVNFSRSRRGTR